MAESPKFPSGWRELSTEDRGLLLTLACGSKSAQWGGVDAMASVLEVSQARVQTFINAAIAAEVLGVNAKGEFSLVESTDDLRKGWERRFDEIFWPAVTTPWTKVGRSNALKVWMTSTFALIKPKTEEAADALCQRIMDGVDRYKILLSQPNAPSMKYPQGWLSGQRWSDEIDDQFIERHAQAPARSAALSPLERARRQQADQQHLIEHSSVIQPTAIQAPVVETPERQNELALPEFTVTL